MNYRSSRQRRFLLGLVLMVLPLVPAAGRPGGGQGDPERLLLEIGQEKITFGEFLLYLEQVNPLMEFAKLPREEQSRWQEEFVAKKLFALRAREAGLDRDPEVRARVEFFADGVLAQALKEKLLREIAVTGAELEAYYEARREDFKLPARVFLQHFLYKSPPKAVRTQARLRKGISFAEIAEEKKNDPDLLLVERSWFTRALLISELADVAFRLPVGGVSDVVRSSYGYHVLGCEASESGQYKDFASARPEVLEKVRQSKAARIYRRVLDETRSRREIRLHLEAPQP